MEIVGDSHDNQFFNAMSSGKSCQFSLYRVRWTGDGLL